MLKQSSTRLFRSNLLKPVRICSGRASNLHRKPVDKKHLVCFQFWTKDMAVRTIDSAINLKKQAGPENMDLLKGKTVGILMEVNEPVLKLAVCKGIRLLGGRFIVFSDTLDLKKDYMGRIYSLYVDAIFIMTTSQICVEQLSHHSSVPVLCARSRIHQSLHCLAIFMTLKETFSELKGLTISYLGGPAPILNSLLLLSPMLGCHLKFICKANDGPVSPMLMKMGMNMGAMSKTDIVQCKDRETLLELSDVVIVGPFGCHGRSNVDAMRVTLSEIEKHAAKNFVFFHCCPRGNEVEDDLFFHERAKTFDVFENIPFIAGSALAYSMLDECI